MEYKNFKLAQALRFRFEDNFYVCLLAYNFIAASVVFFLVAMLLLEFVEIKHNIHFSTFFVFLSLVLLFVGCAILIFRKLKVEIKKFKQKARF
jgi:hypothetical protein